jgi:hypothetical protein
MANEMQQEFVFYSEKLNYKTVAGAKGKEYWIEGHITSEDLDLVNDIVTKNCMDSMTSQFSMRSIKLDFEHEAFRGKSELDAEANKTRLPLGKAVDKERDSKGVKIKWKLNPTWKKFDEKGNVVMNFQEIWQNIEDEYYDAFSIAYVPTKTTIIERDGKTIRLLDDVNLLNVALTGNPINPMATMTSVMAKSLEYLKDQETVDPADLSLMEVKSQVDSLSNEMSKIKKQMGYNQMVDNKDEAPEVEAQSPEAPVEQGNEQAPEAQPEVESSVESEASPKPEGKSVDLKAISSRIDSMEKEIKSLKKDNEDLKAIVAKPLQKSKGAENKEEKSQSVSDEKSFTGPMDMIQ